MDLTKAFDTIGHNVWWRLMLKFCCPVTFITLVRQFYDGMLAIVQDDCESSQPFPVTNGVKQGCVMATTLFSMMFLAMLTDAFHDNHIGIALRYQCDGKLFELWKLQSKTKVQTNNIHDLLFTDNCTLNAGTPF